MDPSIEIEKPAAGDEATKFDTKPIVSPSASNGAEEARSETKFIVSSSASNGAEEARSETKPVGPPSASPSPEATEEEAAAARWGTKHMGPPSPPWAHPENQRAALLSPHRGDEDSPYVLERTPVQHKGGGGGGGGGGGVSPMESILEVFESFGKKAETLALNVWANLKTGPSMTGAAWGKLSMTAKAISGGGFEVLFRQTFPTSPGEKLKKTFACYLSTAAGPVAGTLYLSDVKIAFCSDLPLSFTAPSGQEAWSYYKVAIPLEKIAAVNPVTGEERPPGKYIQIVTVDGREFWFMGFVSFEKASVYIREAVAEHAVAGRAPEAAGSG